MILSRCYYLVSKYLTRPINYNFKVLINYNLKMKNEKKVKSNLHGRELVKALLRELKAEQKDIQKKRKEDKSKRNTKKDIVLGKL